MWQALHQYYGQDFLLECIEEEYGVTNESSEKFKKQIEERLFTLQKSYS